MKVISKTKLNYLDEGANGEYYKIKGTRRGIKVWPRWFSSKEEAIDSDDMARAYHSLSNLIKARSRTDLVPRGYHVALIRFYDKCDKSYYYRCGFVMSHVKGFPLGSYDNSHKYYKKLRKAYNKLFTKGIEITDDHEYNVIKSGRKLVFIDPDSWVISD